MTLRGFGVPAFVHSLLVRALVVVIRKKTFVFQTHQFVREKEILLNRLGEEIFRAIISCVDDCKRSLDGRYVNSTTIESLGLYIDWRTLLHGSWPSTRAATLIPSRLVWRRSSVHWGIMTERVIESFLGLAPTMLFVGSRDSKS